MVKLTLRLTLNSEAAAANSASLGSSVGAIFEEASSLPFLLLLPAVDDEREWRHACRLYVSRIRASFLAVPRWGSLSALANCGRTHKFCMSLATSTCT